MPDKPPVCRPLIAWIDPDAFVSNVRYLQSQAPDSELLLVIKANGYGHGVDHLKAVCEGYRVAVASADEAHALIELGYDNEIVLLEGPFSQQCIARLKGRKVVWVVHTTRQLDQLVELGFEGKIWLKLDTGMHRLGLCDEELPEVLSKLKGAKAAKSIQLEALMSHFSSADEPDLDKTQRQINRLERLIADNGLTHLPVSLSNSAGLLLHPQAQKEIVRPGIALYGGWCAPAEERARVGLKSVMTLESEVIALRQLEPGESVGYGETWTAERSTTLATVAVGYGDGYPRHAPNGTPIFIDGQRASLAGRVSMDMITVDVTGLNGVEIGSKVELWGPNLPVEEVAQKIGTISYELTTGLTARVPRLKKDAG